MSQAAINQQVSGAEFARDDAPTAARPKLLRRPPQFSAPTEKAILPTAMPSLPPLPPSTALAVIPPTRHWQDDGRFGVMLLIILLITNAGLMLWLPHLTHPEKSPIVTPVSIGSTMPAAITNRHPEITLYARPDAPDSSTAQRLLSPIATGDTPLADETPDDSDQ